jgi:hypothetical protein
VCVRECHYNWSAKRLYSIITIIITPALATAGVTSAQPVKPWFPTPPHTSSTQRCSKHQRAITSVHRNRSTVGRTPNLSAYVAATASACCGSKLSATSAITVCAAKAAAGQASAEHARLPGKSTRASTRELSSGVLFSKKNRELWREALSNEPALDVSPALSVWTTPSTRSISLTT